MYSSSSVPAALAGGFPLLSPCTGDPQVLHGVSIGSVDVPQHVFLGDLGPQRSIPAVRRWGCFRCALPALYVHGGTERILASALVRTQPLITIPAAATRQGHVVAQTGSDGGALSAETEEVLKGVQKPPPQPQTARRQRKRALCRQRADGEDVMDSAGAKVGEGLNKNGDEDEPLSVPSWPTT